MQEPLNKLLGYKENSMMPQRIAFKFIRTITSLAAVWICLSSIGLGKGKEALSYPVNEIDHWHFSDVDKDAQMWSGMYIGSNNKIYIGLCTHGDSANLYEFDIDTREMKHLSNLAILLGERGKGIWTNGKIHVRMSELDGYIYFGSFCEDNGPPVIDHSSWQGPWWFRVKMDTGEVEPISKINNYWGLLGQALDEDRRLLYGLAEDGHLYKYYIDDDWTEDLGKVDNWDICRTIMADDLGRVFGSYAPGRIWRYDPEQDRVEDLPFIRLPVDFSGRTMANPMLDRRAQWRYIEWDPIGKTAFGITGGDNILFEYDVHDGAEGSIKRLGRICAPQFREALPFDVPSATLAMTLSRKERKIYYLPTASGDFDYGAVKSLKNKKGQPPLSFLVSYNLDSGKLEDIGYLRTSEGRWAYGMGGAETDSEGRIWFVGAFEEPDPRYQARKIGDQPYAMGLGVYDPIANTE